MSTRSNVAVIDPVTNKLKVIYVHSDGYPDGVGVYLNKFYNSFEKADQLVNHGGASYLGESIDECYFYGRDRGEKDGGPEKHRDEWMYFHSMKGDNMIEYIYVFKDNEWYISECKSVKKPKDTYAGEGVYYWTKLIPLTKHKEYPKNKNKASTSEVEMISQLGDMLKKNFGEDNVLQQGGKIKKMN
jgi:hypothetical protein|tara:strand:+ start:557 stop:1114 length:558 start_codon:yes stop_codon:yes gene_type:complete